MAVLLKDGEEEEVGSSWRVFHCGSIDPFEDAPFLLSAIMRATLLCHTLQPWYPAPVHGAKKPQVGPSENVSQDESFTL